MTDFNKIQRPNMIDLKLSTMTDKKPAEPKKTVVKTDSDQVFGKSGKN